MIRAQHRYRPTIGQGSRHFHTVTKLRFGTHAQLPDEDVKRKLPEHDDGCESWEKFEFSSEVGKTAVTLINLGLVGGWRAANCSNNVRRPQLQSVVAVRTRRLIRKPRPVHRSKQPVPGSVARKNSAGAVRPVSGRRQSQYEDRGLRITKSRHSCTPVVPIDVRRPLFDSNLLTPRHQPRA